MEVNFKVIRALSSPTRVKILNQILEKERTPTQLSNDIGKSKSTISSHLETLKEAELIEKDEEEGRKRVTYSPTRKAETIIRGRERKVKFSVASSALSAFAGIGLGFYYFTQKASYQAQESAGALTAESMDTGADAAASEPSSLVGFSPEIVLFLGIGLLGLSAISFLYGLTVQKLGAN